MIFFRTRREKIILQKSLGKPQGFFVFVRVRLKGEIEPLSGMVKNLKDVDKGFESIFKEPKFHRDFYSACRFFYDQFRTLWGDELLDVSLTHGSRSVRFDGQAYIGESRLQVLFLEEGVETSRRVRVTSPHIPANIRAEIRSQVWKSSEDCLQFLQKRMKKPFSLEVEKPELRLWVKWQL